MSSTSSHSKTTPLPFAYQLMAGTMAGLVEIVCMHPLDVVKTRLQLQPSRGSNVLNHLRRHYRHYQHQHHHQQQRQHGKPPVVASPRPPPTALVPYTSMTDCFAKIIRQEGILRLYRGVLPPLAAETMKRAIKFGANEQWGLAFKKLFSVDQFSMVQAGFIGALAGATEALWVTPFDLVKVRLQDRASIAQYTGTFDCVRKISTQEGILTISHGLEATIWRHASFSGVYFMFIHAFRTALPPRPNTTTQEAMLRNFVAGTLGGFLGTLASTPFDVVKSRVQNQRKGSHAYGFALPAVAKIYREEGLAPRTIRLGLGGGLMLVVFDGISNLIRQHVTVQPPLESA